MKRSVACAAGLWLVSALCWALDPKELTPARPQEKCMWYHNDSGVHMLLVDYVFIDDDAAKALEEYFSPYVFYVLAVWNQSGQANLTFVGNQHVFRLCDRTGESFGNVDYSDTLRKRVRSGMQSFRLDRRQATKMRDRFVKGRRTDVMFSDPLGEWAKERKLTSMEALKAFEAKLDAVAVHFERLETLMTPINCAVGDNRAALMGVRKEGRDKMVEQVFLVESKQQIPMQCVRFTKKLADQVKECLPKY